MLKFIVNVMILLVIISCKENSTEPEMGNDPALVGKWELVSVSVGGTYYNPGDLGVPIGLLFEEDGSGKFWDSEGDDFFTWKTSGRKIYIDGEDVMNYSIYGVALIMSYQEDGEKVELTFGQYKEPEMGNDPALVGNWNLVSIKVDTTYYNPDDLLGFPTRLSFATDGSGKFGIGTTEEIFTWTTSEGQLYIDGEDIMDYAIYVNTLLLSFYDNEQLVELSYGK